MDATNIILRLIWQMKSINIYQKYQYIRRKVDKKRRIMVSFLRMVQETPPCCKAKQEKWPSASRYRSGLLEPFHGVQGAIAAPKVVFTVYPRQAIEAALA